MFVSLKLIAKDT